MGTNAVVWDNVVIHARSCGIVHRVQGTTSVGTTTSPVNGASTIIGTIGSWGITKCVQCEPAIVDVVRTLGM